MTRIADDILQALEIGFVGTAQMLTKIVYCSPSTAISNLNRLRDKHSNIRIKEWVRGGTQWVPVYWISELPDAGKPRPMTTGERSAKRRRENPEFAINDNIRRKLARAQEAMQKKTREELDMESPLRIVREKIKTIKGEFTQESFADTGLLPRQISMALHTLCARKNEIIFLGTTRVGRLKPSNKYIASPDYVAKMREKEERERGLEEGKRPEPELEGLPVILGIDPASIPRHAITVHRSR